MSEILFYLVMTGFIVSILGLLVCHFLLYRNEKVFQFRNQLRQKCLEWSLQKPHRESAFLWCYEKVPTYYKMVFSLKPLKPENWLTEFQYKELFGK